MYCTCRSRLFPKINTYSRFLLWIKNLIKSYKIISLTSLEQKTQKFKHSSNFLNKSIPHPPYKFNKIKFNFLNLFLIIESTVQMANISEPKLPTSISNIGGATLCAKTAEFEKNHMTKASIPTARAKPLYKRQQLIPSSKR